MKSLVALSALTRVAAVAAIVGLPVSLHAGIVIILEGSDTNAKTNAGIHQIADIAETNYTAKGYTIQRHPNTGGPVTRTAAKNAINKTGVNAVFFAGHGTAGTSRLVLDYPSGGAADKGLTPGDLTGDYSGIKHVEIQACQQNQPGWSGKFPGANLDAWTGSITVDQAKNDAKNGSPGRIPAKTPPGNVGTGAAKTGMSASFLNQVLTMPDSAEAGPGYMCGDWTQLGWQLQPSLGLALGTFSFNIRTVNGSDFLPLRGLTVVNGVVVDDVNQGYLATPSFTLTMDWLAFDLAMQNQSLLPTFFAGGQATIDNNTTAFPASLLFQGSAAAYFGYNAIPAPATATLLSLAGIAAVRRRRAIN